MHSVHGLGGIGKTQLALEYAHRYATRYDLVWWILAERRTSVLGGLAELASKLGITGVDLERDVIAPLFDELRRRGNWLIVFDNVEHPDDIRSYLPQGGHVVITSRDPNWGCVATPHGVDVMSEEEAVAFLAKRIVPLAGDDKLDQAELADLAQLLDNLPLALEQAAAYIERNRISPGRYAAQFREHPVRLLDASQPTNYSRTIGATWSISIARIEEQQPTAVALLRLCAFLGPESVPRQLLASRPQLLPEPLAGLLADEFRYDAAVGMLASYSMVRAVPGTLGMHRLVQLVVRLNAPEGERFWSGVAVRLLDELLPWASHRVPHWPIAALLLPHVAVAVERARRLGVEPTRVRGLLARTGLYLHSRVRLVEARAAFGQALEIPPGGDETAVAAATLHEQLGRVLQDLGETAGAHQQYARALDILTTTHGPKHPRIAGVRSNIGRLLQEEGQLGPARAELETAVVISESALGPDHRRCAPIRSHLGRVLQDLGDMEGARAEYERALVITESTYGSDDPRVAAHRNALAGALSYLARYAEARAQLEFALDVVTDTYGPEDPRSLPVRINLAGVLHDLGKYRQAETGLRRALQIARESVGLQSPTAGTVRVNLAAVLRDRGHAQAVSEARRALEVETAIYPLTHPRIGVARTCLGSALQQHGDAAGAVVELRLALAIGTGIYQEHHPRVAVVRCALGVALQDLEHVDEAGDQLRTALADTRETYGTEHPRLVAIYTNLARAEAGRGADGLRQAGELLRSALTVGTAFLGSDHPAVSTAAGNLRALDNGADWQLLAPLYITIRTYQPFSMLDC